MKIQAVLTAVVTMVLMSAGSAFATPMQTIDGSYTVTYTATHGNGPSSIPKDLATPFSENLTVGTPTSPTNFFTVDPNGSCGSGCVNSTASGTLSVVFSFSNLTVATGSIPSLTEAATYEAKYGGSELGCSNSGTGDTDCVLWGSTTSGYTGTTSITDVIDFTIRPYSMLHKGHTVWEPGPPFDSIPYNLFACDLEALGLNEKKHEHRR